MFSLSTILTRISDCRRRFQKSTDGAVAVIVALSVIPLMVAAGLAVDLSRAYLAQARLSHSLDAAGLAVGTMRTTNSDSTYLEAQFNSFFSANYPDDEIGTTHDLTFVDNGGIITVSGKATVETIFMSIVGIDDLTVSASAEIEVETSGLELVMVLDNTGSMGSSNKLSDMQDAAHELIDILFGDETEPELLKVGLVPFSGSVNIGTGMAAYVEDTSTYDWGDSSWDGCVMARTYPDDTEDTWADTGDNWVPFNWEDSDWYNNWDRDTWYNIDDSPPSYIGPNKYCPREVTPLTNNRTTLDDEIDEMWAAGYTHINYGAVWGWRLISPDEPFTEGTAYDDEDWNKAVIILTDGANTTSNSVFTAYEYRWDGVLGSTTSSGTTDELNDRTTEVCDNMKSEGIIVYTITFNVTDTDTQNLFEDCASGVDKYYNSPDSDTLTIAFRAIGAELKKLHLSQ